MFLSWANYCKMHFFSLFEIQCMPSQASLSYAMQNGNTFEQQKDNQQFLEVCRSEPAALTPLQVKHITKRALSIFFSVSPEAPDGSIFPSLEYDLILSDSLLGSSGFEAVSHNDLSWPAPPLSPPALFPHFRWMRRRWSEHNQGSWNCGFHFAYAGLRVHKNHQHTGMWKFRPREYGSNL